MKEIRNFCIIAHIDHGKSTLADRFLEITGLIEPRKSQHQILDSMDLERERGITIKLSPVRMEYSPPTRGGRSSLKRYTLNLIDTPGHVDFSYEVSRSLAAVEGAILLVDATQNIQAQTLSNLYLALEQDLVIIPAVNKIDLPNAQIKETKSEISKLLGCSQEEIIEISAKTGQNVENLLIEIIKRLPPPQGDVNKPLQALVFDSQYDEFRGVITLVRLMNGSVTAGQEIYLTSGQKFSRVLEVGVFAPHLHKKETLEAGEIGYIVTGLKDLPRPDAFWRQPSQGRLQPVRLKAQTKQSSHHNQGIGQGLHLLKIGDTIINAELKEKADSLKLPGYQEVKPMVWAGLFSEKGEPEELRQALEKLSLNDSSLSCQPESNESLGHGFRCGFLGLLHLEIVQERLRREFNQSLIVTAPSVTYKVYLEDEVLEIKSPRQLPSPEKVKLIQEPWVKLDVFTPKKYLGHLLQLVASRRGVNVRTDYLDTERVVLRYVIPLNSIILDFYDKVKSVSQGYASLNWEFDSWRPTKLTSLEIWVAEEKVEALTTLVRSEEAQLIARQIVNKLKETLPRQQFTVKIQAKIGGKIISAERLSPLRKDVTAKLYGGDITRKRKLLEKQKKGKKKMMTRGKVTIPPESFLAVLKREY